MSYELIFQAAARLTGDMASIASDKLFDGVVLAADTTQLAVGNVQIMVGQATDAATAEPSGIFVFLFTIFLLAVFVGYYVVWNVTPALHSPLMGVTNAISSVIIVGALIAAGPADMSLSKVFGIIAIGLASVNIFGGFIVTQRMLQMFKKKK